MKRVMVKAYQSKPAQTSAPVKRERRGHVRDNQDQFFGFPTERLVTEKIVPRPNKRHLTESTTRPNLGAPNRTLKNKSSWSQNDQYSTRFDHVNSEKVSTKKTPESSKIAEDNLQCTPVTCKRTWLRQVKVPKSITSVVNRKHSFSPRRTDVTRKKIAFKCDRRGFKIVPHRFSKSDCMAARRNMLDFQDEKNLSSECLNLQSLLENPMKTVPSQSWSVNADAIPSLRRSSTTIFSHKTCLKPTDEFGFLNRESGDLSAWMVEGLDVTKAGQPSTRDQTKKHSENYNPLADSSKSKSSNVVIHQNIKQKVLIQRKVSSTMSKPRSKPKRNKDQAHLNDSTESQSLSVKYRSQLNSHTHATKHEETDLSMIPMKDSDSKESLMSDSIDDSDKVVNMLSQCSTANSWDPYNVHAEEGTMKCSNQLCSGYLMNFDPTLNHLGDVPGQNFSKPQMKSGELEPFMRIRLKSSKVDAVPVKPSRNSRENLNSLTDSGDWSKFTPVCHIYNGSAPSKFSSLNVGSRNDDDSIKVINIEDPTFFKASETAVISELKDTTSTWMTGHLETHSRVSFTSSVVEEQTLESKKDDMPSGFRVNANRITLHVESTGMRLQHNNKTCLQSNSEQSRSIIKNELESADRSQISLSSSSDEVNEINQEDPKMFSLNKQEDRINSSTFKKHNWRSEHISMAEKNIVKLIPSKSQMAQLNAIRAHDNFIKRAVFLKRKPNRRNIFGKTLTNRHKGFKDQSKILRNYVIPKQEKFSARFSPIRKTKKTNRGMIHTDTTKSTFNRETETPANTKNLNKEIGLQCYRFSPSIVHTEPVAADDKLAFFSSAEMQRKTHEFQRSASYPPAIKENQKMLNDEIPVMGQGVQKAETVVLTVTNVQTSTTNFSERCTCIQEEAANRQFGQRFRIRVFVKPQKKRPYRRLDQEANVVVPATFGEDEKAHDAIKCETARTSKSVGELSNKSSGAESTSTQFQSLQDFLSASYSKNDLTGFVCKDKRTCDHGSGTGFEPLSKPRRVTATYSGATHDIKESCSVWNDAVSPSPKVRKVKSPHTQAPCLPRYPRRLERRQKAKSSWGQVHSEITPIVRPLILVMFFLCVVYVTLMTAFSLHTIQKY